MARIIAIANQKGGVGKTTTAINLSAALAAMGKKILTIDVDPQGNTTSGLGLERSECEYTIYELILSQCTLEDCILDSPYDNLQVIPSNVNLAGAEIELIGTEEREYILKDYIDTIRDNYDFIIIDTSSNIFLDSLKWAVQIATKVFFVTEANYLSMKKSTQLLNIFISTWNVWKEKIKIVVNKENLETLGIDVVEQILEEYEVIGNVKYMEEGLEHSYTQMLEKTNFIPKQTFTSKLLAMANFKEYLAQNSMPVNS